MSEAQFVIPLSSAAAADVERVGPKAANLAALARAGLPMPGGFCLTAEAYRRQIAEIGLSDLVARFGAADLVERRRLSVAIRLGLYEQPIAPAVLEPLMAAWRGQRAPGGAPAARRPPAVVGGPQGADIPRPLQSLLHHGGGAGCLPGG